MESLDTPPQKDDASIASFNPLCVAPFVSFAPDKHLNSLRLDI